MHPWIRRLNRHRLEQAHGAAAIRLQHAVAAAWLTRHAPGLDAISHALLADDEPAALAITRDLGFEAIATERWSRLAALLDALPANLGDHDPGIITLRTWRLWHDGAFGAVASGIDRARAAFALAPADHRARGHLEALASALAITPPDPARARAALEAATHHLPPNDTVARGFALQSFSLAAIFAGTPSDAEPSIRHYVGGPSPTAIGISARALTSLANITYYSYHDLPAMRAYLVEAESVAGIYDLPITRSLAQSWLTILAALRLDFEAIERSPFVHARLPGDLPLTLWRELRYCLALAHAWRGDHLTAATIANEVVAAFQAKPGSTQHHHAFRARIALLAGDLDTALPWALATTSDTVNDLPMMLDAPAITAIRALVASSDPGHLASAAVRAEIAVATARARHHRPYLALALATHAMIRGKNGDLVGAFHDLHLPLADAARNRAPLRLLELGPAFAELLDLVPDDHPQRNVAALLSHHIRAGSMTRIDWDAIDRRRTLELTAREREVLTLMALPLGNKAIADALHISPATVKHHVANLLAKFGGASRRDAVRQAQTLGFVGSRLQGASDSEPTPLYQTDVRKQLLNGPIG